MANLTETAQWEEGIYRIETSDPVVGGENGISNRQAKLLGNRTLYLKQRSDRAIGSASLLKHCVITGKHSGNTPAFISYTDGAGTVASPNVVTINASALEPLVLSFSGGYSDNGPVNYYKRITSNQTINITNNNKQYIIATYNPSTGNVAFSCIDFSSYQYRINYQAPIDLPGGITNVFWYDLRNDVMKSSEDIGITYSDVYVLFLGTIDPAGSGTLVYYPTVGIDMMTLYGKGPVSAGVLQEFAGPVSNIPTGYLLANGATLSRYEFASLFNAIGTTYGAGDGLTTFNIPDLRGEFIRGLDNGRAIDAGRTLGSAQADAFKTHTHLNMSVSLPTGRTDTLSAGSGIFVGGGSSVNTQATGGTETRPRNVAVNIIIKY